MRGLTLFITDLRKCRGQDEELSRINKELANIRSKFKGDKPLNGYHKKKYVCKLLFMFLLGHKCEIGHLEAINLLSSSAYSEKQIGYLFISVVMRDNHNYIPLIINSLKTDLSSGSKVIQNLALQFIANSSNKDIADALANQVLDLLLLSDAADFVKQTAALTFLQLLRLKPDISVDPCKINRIINLISNYHLGVVTASVSLIDFMAKKCYSPFLSCIPHCVGRLSRIVTSAYIDFRDYNYYSVAAPWLTVKLLRLLQNFPAPTDVCLKSRLQEILESILSKSQEFVKPKKSEHANAKYAVIFEAISLIIQMDIDTSLLFKAITILGNSLNYKEANTRFMSLDMMAQLTDTEICLGNLRMHWESVLETLKTETDITIKKRAIDLLYNICNRNNVKPIVSEMLYYVETESDSALETILKIAALAEKFKTDLQWYVDTLFTTLQASSNDMDEEIWYTLIKVITDNDNIQEYAARTAYNALHQYPCNDAVVKAAGYILGEFGYFIDKDIRSSHRKQLRKLHEKYFSCSHSTRALLLTTYMKFLNIYPDLKHQIQSILKEDINARSENVEIQQRAIEYLKLSNIESENLLSAVLEEIPSSIRKETAVFRAMEKRKFLLSRKASMDKALSQNKLFHYRSTMNLKDIPKRTPEKQFQQINKSMSYSNLRESNASTNLNLLMEIFNEKPIRPKPAIPVFRTRTSRIPDFPTTATNENYLHNFLFNEKGVLFEDEVICVLVESEFRRHIGKFRLTFQNRSLLELTDISLNSDFASTEDKCSIWFKPNIFTIEVNGSVEQDIHLECLGEFSTKPHLILRFIYDNGIREIKIILPLTVNKFTEPASMSAQDFKKRWENLQNVGHDVVKDIPAKYPMLQSVTRLKLTGFRVAVIENVSPYPESVHCAGIFYTRSNRTGFLIHLVVFPQATKYRLTVRSNQKNLSETISNLLCELF